MPAVRICLIHGAATTPTVWRSTVAALAVVLPNARVECPRRLSSGSLDLEVEALAPYADEAIVVGVSGGATLGLELAARGVALPAAILHEPAVGSLLPGLLNPVAEAYALGGPPAFAAALYGPAWQPEMAPADLDAIGRDLAMFRRFEPNPPTPECGPIVITVGANSPPVRHEAARRLSEQFGFQTQTIPDARHAVHLEQPQRLAELIAELASPRPLR